jgi:hypothetical protein
MPPAQAPKTPRPTPGDLNSTEEKVLRAAAHLPFFLAEDITRLLSTKGSQGSHYRAILKTLSVSTPDRKTAYLHRFKIPQSAGNSQNIYTLTRRGAGLLQRLGVDTHFWYRPWKASHHSFSFLQHHLSVSKFLVALSCFVRQNPSYQLVDLQHGFDLSRKPPLLTQSVEGQETSIPVIPDAWGYIERTNADSTTQGFALWIEVDCGTETKSKFQQLVLNRINIVRSKEYQTYFDSPSVLFCYLTVGATEVYRRRRLYTLRGWINALLTEQQLMSFASVFRLSTLEETLYTSHALYTDPFWYCLNSDTPVPLFSPPPEKEQPGEENNSAPEIHTNP